MRAIEQFSNIAAPIVTGFLMTFGSMIISAIFIVCWNIISVFVEYALLARIYDQVPDLAIKNKHSKLLMSIKYNREMLPLILIIYHIDQPPKRQICCTPIFTLSTK